MEKLTKNEFDPSTYRIKMEKLTKFEFDPSTYRITPIFGEVDEVLQSSLYNSRIEICKQCENFIFDASVLNSFFKCKICGCMLEYKTKIIYPIDEDGKSFMNTNPNTKEKYYVCKIKKW